MSNEFFRPKRSNGLALLCFDAGGARVVSQLTMLGDIMQRWKMKKDPNMADEIPPCLVFDAICGVGIGGLAAILLVVFGMTAEKALETLSSAGEVLTGATHSTTMRSNMLREWAIKLLEDHEISPRTKLLEGSERSRSCRLVVPITSKENAGTLDKLRNYHSREPPLDMTMVEAILATCADPGLFEPVSIRPNGVTRQYVSGATTLPNPTREFIAEIHSYYGADTKVASLMSLGAGKSTFMVIPSGAGSSQTEFQARMSGDSERVAQEMLAQIGHLPLYLRLSVEQGIQDISLNAWNQTERIVSCTRAYLDDANVEAKLEAGIDSLAVQTATATLDQLRRSGGNAVPSPSIPPITSYYVDRPGPMAELVNQMESSDSNEQKIVVVSGLGGCGKTTLVLKYVKDRQPQYKSVFFIDGGSRETLVQERNSSIEEADTRIRASLTQYVRSLGPEHSQKTFEDAMSYLRRPINGDRLIVFDNIDDPELDLDPYIPECTSVSIIITTRDPDRGQLASLEPIVLDVMSSQEAVKLLFATSKRTRNAYEEVGALKVAEILGFHPIALVQAGSYMAQIKIKWWDYMRIHEESRKMLMDQRVRNQRGMRYSSAYAAFDASYKTLSSQAQQLLHLLSFFHRLNIPLELIIKGAEEQFESLYHLYMDYGEQYRTGKRLLEEIFYSQGTWSEVHMNSLITTLQNYSFISITETPYMRLINLHSLIHTWARDRINDEAYASYKDASIRLLSCGSELHQIPMNQSLATHVMHLAPLWDSLHVNDKGSFGLILQRAVMYEPAKQLSEAVLETVKEEAPIALEEIAFGTSELSIIVYWLGDYKRALKLTEEALRLRREALGEDNILTTSSMLIVALNYREMGRLTEALKLGEDVLNLRKKTLGEKHLDTIEAMESVAGVHYTMGKLDEALELEKEVLSLRQELSGEDAPETIHASSLLGAIYGGLGRYLEAFAMEEKVLRVRKELLGKEHPETIHAMGNLGSTCFYLRRFTDALELEEETLRLNKKVLGEQNLDTISASSKLARTYTSMGRFQEALTLHKDVLKRRREILGNDHPRTISTIWYLASTYRKLGGYEDAAALEEEARKLQVENEQKDG